MRVLEAISDMNIGGAGRLLLTRVSAVSKREDGIEYAVLLPKGSLLHKRFADIGVRCYLTDGGGDRSLDISAVKEICAVIKAYKPDVVNTHGCAAARLAAFFCGVPIRIYTRHCAYELPIWQRLLPIRAATGAVGALISTNGIAVADAAKKNMIQMGYPKNRISVIINGVNGLRKYSPEERKKCREELGIDDSFAVGICARIEPCKDHACFLRAAALLCGESDRYRFLVIGDGSAANETRELALELGIADKVIFTGFTDEVEKYFNCLDLNVNCSTGTETSSLALSEGMSIGLPAVASSFGGNPYMVRHGENGYIYEKGDHTELAERISEIASDRELYKKMSEQAYERYVTELNAKNMKEKTEALYTNLYNKKNRRS